jgi:hypothetical protein
MSAGLAGKQRFPETAGRFITTTAAHFFRFRVRKFPMTFCLDGFLFPGIWSVFTEGFFGQEKVQRVSAERNRDGS